MRAGRYLLLLALGAGCSEDNVTPGDGGSSTGGDGSGGSDTTALPPATDDTASTTTTGDPAATADTTGAGEAPLPLARGIRMLRVAANQGVQFELVRDGLQVPPEENTARLIAGRRTLVRGFWSLHADFQPRELIGRLDIEYPDGTTLQQDYPLFVDGESTDAGASMQWLLEPDEVVDGMQFRARILEADPDAASGELSDPPPIAPLSGPAPIPVYDVPLRLEVVLVPLLHQLDDCEQAPEIGPEDVAAMREQLEQNNPVQVANFTVREPMPYTAPIGTAGAAFSEVLTALSQQRELDAPGPNVYYYGLIDSCDGYPPGLLGQAIGIPPEPLQELQHQRVSTGRWNGSGAGAAETFVHEVGHTQGRRHVLCSGGEAGVDDAYPHQGGRIGVWGFGIHDFQLRTPTGGRDYMTYCANEWVSDYGWEQVLGVIETLTSWDEEGAVPPTPGAVLMGAIEPDGRETWWTARGGVPGSLLPPGGPELVIRDASGKAVRSGAWIYTRPHGDTIQVVAPLPEGFDAATRIEVHAEGRATLRVDPRAIRRLHAR